MKYEDRVATCVIHLTGGGEWSWVIHKDVIATVIKEHFPDDSDRDATIARLRGLKLATFIRDLMYDDNGFYATEVDGCDFEEKAHKAGIAVHVIATQQDVDDDDEGMFEVGDNINNWSPEFKKILQEEGSDCELAKEIGEKDE